MSYTPPAYNAIHLSNGPSYTPPAHDAIHLTNTRAAFVFITPATLAWTGTTVLEASIAASIAVPAENMAWTATTAIPSETRAYLSAGNLTWAETVANGKLLLGWNDADRATNLTLSNSQRTATVDNSNGTTWGLVRAPIGRSTGKFYFEITLAAGDDAYVAAGLASASEALDVELGLGANAWALTPQSYGGGSDASLKHNGATASWGGPVYSNTTLMFAVDFSVGALWIGVGGVWWGSVNPATGAGFLYSDLSGTLYPAAGLQYQGVANALTLRMNPQHLLYSVPTGFTAWGSDLLTIAVTKAILGWTGQVVYTQAVSAGAPDTLTWAGVDGVDVYQSAVVLWQTPMSRTLTTAGMLPSQIYNYRATHYKATGKWYFEVDLQDIPQTFTHVGFIPYGGYFVGEVGGYADGWGFQPRYTGDSLTESLLHHNDPGGVGYGVAFGATGRLQVAVDVDAGKVWFGSDNVWMESGNPITGDNPAFTGLPANLYPVVSISLRSGSGDRTVLVGCFASVDQVYAPPTGYESWQPAQRIAVTAGMMTWTAVPTYTAGEPIPAGAMAWTGGVAPELQGVSAISASAGAVSMTPNAVASVNGAYWSRTDRAAGVEDYWPALWPAHVVPDETLMVKNDTGYWRGVRSTVGRSSGKWLWRVIIYGAEGGLGRIKVGVVDQAANLESAVLGNRTSEWMLEMGGDSAIQRLTWLRNGALPPYSGYNTPYPGMEYHGKPVRRLHTFSETYSGDPIYFAMDLDAGKLWAYDPRWWDNYDGDPGPINSDRWLLAENLAGTGPLYPCVSLRRMYSDDPASIAYCQFSGPIRWEDRAYDGSGIHDAAVIGYDLIPDGFDLFMDWARPAAAPLTLTGVPVTYTGGTAAMSCVVTLTFPALTLTAESGAAVQMTFPALTLTAEARAQYCEAHLTLPALTLTAQGGGGAQMTLPALTLTATGTVPVVAQAALTLPALTLTATALSGALAQAHLTLPKLTLAAFGGARATLALPALTLTATATPQARAVAQMTLPALTLTATATFPTVAQVRLTLPALILTASDIPNGVQLILPALILTAHAATVYDPVALSTGYVVNLETRAVTEWTPAPFERLICFQGVTYVLQQGTLYRIGGDTDDGDPIAATVRFAPGQFGDFQKKRLNEVWINGRIMDGVTLSVYADEETEWQYQTDADAQTALGSHRVKVGRGVECHSFGIRISNRAGGRFDIASILYAIDSLSRKTK